MLKPYKRYHCRYSFIKKEVYKKTREFNLKQILKFPNAPTDCYDIEVFKDFILYYCFDEKCNETYVLKDKEKAHGKNYI